METSKSGVRFKYRLFNDENNVLLSSASTKGADEDGFLESTNEFIILHRPVDKNPWDAPFKLAIEYKYEPKTRRGHSEEEHCP